MYGEQAAICSAALGRKRRRFAGMLLFSFWWAVALGPAQTPSAPVTGQRVPLIIRPVPATGPSSSRAGTSMPLDRRSLSGVTQDANSSGLSLKHSPPSLPHLYWHFLLYQNHLDRAAAAHEQQRKDGNWLRNHFQQRLNFSDAQFAIVRQTAQRLEPELKEITSKAKVIIEADRAWARSNPSAFADSSASGAVTVGTVGGPRRVIPQTPGRAQLKELQQQHEDMIQKEVSSLKTALGPELAAKLDNFLQTTWARNVTSTHFQPRLQRALRAPMKIPPPEVPR
jgi:hypothetical protein